jgi:TonB-linked SusC/RagA family outer membrane protein
MLGLLLVQISNAQQRSITGQVSDAEGLSLPGVNVIVKGTNTGTITDLDGLFTIEASGEDTLQFSFIGYLRQDVPLGTQDHVNITLIQDFQSIDEVVVIGYGTQKKSDLTGATGIISTKDSDLQPISRVEGFLQGKVAGVNVSRNSGAPGAALKVNIRGFTGAPVYVIDGFIGGDINAINPNDIESMTILKDASATAIYGSRGANGVILIQTKTGGMSDSFKVDVDYLHSVSSRSKKLSLLDPVSYMKVVNAKAYEGGALEIFSAAEIDDVENNGIGTDWQDEVFRNAHTDDLQLSISKGGEKNSFRLSLGAHLQDGIIINSDYQRYTVRFNSKSKLTKTTSLIFNASNSFEQLHNTFQGSRGDAENKVVESAVAWAPNVTVYDPVTNDYNGFQGYGPTTKRNPVYLALDKNRYRSNNVFSSNLSLEQEFLSDFKVQLFGAVQLYDWMSNSFNRFEPATLDAVSSANSNSGLNKKFQGSFQFSYNRDFKNNSRLDAVAVVESQLVRNNSFGFEALDPYTDQLGIYSANVAASFPSGYAEFIPGGMISYLGRAVYSYHDKLLVTGSARVDGSSRLSEGNKYQPFFSGALAYRLSEEDFIKNIDAISDLKLRVSYGETGNVNSVSAFQVQDLINNNIKGYAMNGSLVAPGSGYENGSNRTNPDLIWETSRQFNTGIDLSLIRGMISITGDYYIKYTYDTHFRKQVPHYLGGGSVISNTGQFKNNGVELQVATKWLEKSSKNWSLNTSVNFTYNISEVLLIPEDSLRVGSQQSGFDIQSHIMIIGQPVGQLAGYEYLGVKREGENIPGSLPSARPGDALYRDMNGDGQLNIDDINVIGNGHPDFTWGLNANLAYKNLSLNIFIQGVHGMEIFNMPAHFLLGGGSGVIDGTSTELVDSWTFNKGGELPALTANFRRQSSLFVEDASFIRINNITLAYDLPRTLFGHATVRAHIGVQNLLTITSYSGYDPETHSGGNLSPGVDKGSFPIPRTITVGLKIGIK